MGINNAKEMERKNKKVKVVYTDDGQDKVFWGYIIEEDTYFYTLKSDRNETVMKIGKKAITSVKEVE